MNEFRYAVALMVIITVPLALAYWFAVHPFIAFWRRIGPRMSAVALSLLCIAITVVVIGFRSYLLGTALQSNPLLFDTGLSLVVVSLLIGIRLRKQLSVRTMLGIPEFKQERGSETLLTTGIYARVRHPRYVSVLLGVAGFSMMANYVGVYLFTAAFFPGLLLLVALEERELRERFGEAYREYSARVPRFIPRIYRG